MEHGTWNRKKERCRALCARHSYRPVFYTKAFTLLEALVVIAVGAIIMTVVVNTFFTANGIQALDKQTAVVLSLVDQARNQTLSSKNASTYGIHLQSDKAVLFSGSAYVSGAAGNVIETVNHLVQISSIALTGGGSDVVFDRLTGATSQNGTFDISLVASSTQKKTITIFATGLAQSN